MSRRFLITSYLAALAESTAGVHGGPNSYRGKGAAARWPLYVRGEMPLIPHAHVLLLSRIDWFAPGEIPIPSEALPSIGSPRNGISANAIKVVLGLVW